MKISPTNQLVLAAAAGLVAAACGGNGPTPESPEGGATDASAASAAAEAPADEPAGDPASCKGEHGCKHNGECKGEAECKGEGECKAEGECKGHAPE